MGDTKAGGLGNVEGWALTDIAYGRGAHWPTQTERSDKTRVKGTFFAFHFDFQPLADARLCCSESHWATGWKPLPGRLSRCRNRPCRSLAPPRYFWPSKRFPPGLRVSPNDAIANGWVVQTHQILGPRPPERVMNSQTIVLFLVASTCASR